MKNPLAIIAALEAGFSGIMKTGEYGYSRLRRSQGRGKRWVGHKEGIATGPGYNKAMLRCHARSRKPDWGKAT